MNQVKIWLEGEKGGRNKNVIVVHFFSHEHGSVAFSSAKIFYPFVCLTSEISVNSIMFSCIGCKMNAS